MEIIIKLIENLGVMQFVVVLIAVLVILGTLLQKDINNILDLLEGKNKKKKKEAKLPYRKEKYLMNIPEKNFFKKLKGILPEGYIALPQVSLNSILRTKSGKDYMKYQNKINRKIMDFVVLKMPNYNPVLVIEYDGSSHNRKDRRKRDAFLDKALKAADLEIVHFKHRRNLSTENIEDSLKETSLFSDGERENKNNE